MTYQGPPQQWQPPTRPPVQGYLPPEAYQYTQPPIAPQPPPYGPPPAFQPRSASKPSAPRRSWGMLAAGVAIGAVVTAAAIFGIPAAFGSDTIRVNGTLTLTDNWTNSNGSCVGSGGYNDLAPGVQVTISDNTGKTLAAVPLGHGLGQNGICVFTFTASVPGDRSSYGVTVSHRGTIDFTPAQIATAALTIGS